MNCFQNKIYFKSLLTGLLLMLNTLLSGQMNHTDSLKLAGKFMEALEIYQKEFDTDIKNNNIRNQCVDLNNIANIYSDIGDYEKSTEFYFKAIKIAEQMGNTEMLSSIFYNIANNYFNAGKPKYSIEFLNKIIKLFPVEKGNESILGNCYNMLGGLVIYDKKFDEALDYLRKAERLFTISKQANSLTNVYVNIANLGIEKHDFQLTEEYSLKSLEEFKVEKDFLGIAASYINLQVVEFNKPHSNDAVYKQNLLKSIALLDSATLGVKDINSPETKIVIYENKNEVYFNLKQFDSAYVYQKKYYSLKDSIHNIEKNKQLDELKVSYDVEKKEQENLLLQETAQNKNYLVIILVIVLIVIVLLAALVFRSIKFKSKHKEMQLEQQLLRLQMNPHFLFNAINSIQRFILKKSQQEAYDYLAKFAKLIRIVLNNSQEKTLVLQQELEMIELYVELEQLRFNNAFDFNLNVDSGVHQYQVHVPPMLIQPYIENAIWHGLMNLKNERKGILNVSLNENKGILKIEIEDNGVGRESAKEFKSENMHQSVGMRLTEQRLLLINKMEEYEKAKVIVTDLYDINKTPRGTSVEIFIPINGK